MGEGGAQPAPTCRHNVFIAGPDGSFFRGRMILEAILHSLIKTRCDVLESNPALLKKTAGGVGGGAAPPPVANTTSFRRVPDGFCFCC